VGIAPEAVLGSWGRRFGLVVVVVNSNWRFTVRVVHGGSLTVVKYKTGSEYPSEAPCTSDEAGGRDCGLVQC
jgi:hypothetical protein